MKEIKLQGNNKRVDVMCATQPSKLTIWRILRVLLVSWFSRSADCPASDALKNGKVISSQSAFQEKVFADVTWPITPMVAAERNQDSFNPN
jgi:hypothetical protein